MTISVLTVDDEPLALRRLELILAKIPDVDHVGSAGGCGKALEMIAEARPDVVLLDIKMRDGTGFDVLDRLPADRHPGIIFTTAFDHFAVQAFETHAIDYILKPVEAGRLRIAIDRSRQSLAAADAREQIEQMRAVIDDLRAGYHGRTSSPRDDELWLRSAAGALTCVQRGDIEMVTAEDDYVRLHTASASYLIRGSIKATQANLCLSDEEFVRVHRRTLLRRGSMVGVRRSAELGVRIRLRDGTEVAAGRVYARKLLRSLPAIG
ncbi:MAG: response regulator transcription factor [Sphingopyxis sp.]|uniref:LytR/AlgR family response regulator transcription factor n=1 Tax=Sphingopyxis sp. TaxID=1908224 RepID=UPI001A347E2E|nr:response regulator transcription factor [Sphingopyxis sp.]MBJ7498368.1 response regulator transcription factor [Sphingopyxis sp.]